uniref:Uncharacterized protein n=1 Tax=Phytophthora ramorum TaxID=164328 RepID=H3GXR8_PHYRM
MAVCEEHPGWNRRTVAHYYAMYERGESLQPRIVDEQSALQNKKKHDVATLIQGRGDPDQDWARGQLHGPQQVDDSSTSTAAFDGARHAETFETRTTQTHLDSYQALVRAALGRRTGASMGLKYSACFMYFGEDEDETKYPPGEEDEDVVHVAVVRYHIVLRDVKPVYKKKFGKDLRELLLSVFD